MKIEKIKESKLSTVDFGNLSFGSVYSDHMFECDYKNGKWQNPMVRPYSPLLLEPSSSVFHYGQACFEGMKGYIDKNDEVWLFRPEDNFNRINKSSKRLCIPEFSKEYFFEGLETIMKLDKQWIPKGIGNSLYIRPFVFATQPSVQASWSTNYKFMIICAPVSSYYDGGASKVRVKIADKFSRAASGGVGFAKAAGNYAAQFYPSKLALEEGYQQIIWTDSETHQYLEEAGTMNIFFRINDTLVTANIDDKLLDGITRKSIITLAKDLGIKVEERPITVTELVEAHKNQSLKEIFGTGTAVVVQPIHGFGYKNKAHDLEDIESSFAQQLKQKLVAIQYNEAEDPYGWRHPVV